MGPSVRAVARGAAVAATSIGLIAPTVARAGAEPVGRPAAVRATDLDQMTILDLQQAMERHRLTAEQLTGLYLDRIRHLNPRLGAVRQPTTAGSTALSAAKPAKDAELVRRLREAGAVVLGKANMTEWANFRSPMAVGLERGGRPDP
ncbi:amidase family protein [Kitasatospora sp. NPDC086009]|uniref:amidase family protein n=1 Tax=unclassified Kitasatospora TaxID=2633591 RepID=UPI0037C6E9D1